MTINMRIVSLLEDEQSGGTLTLVTALTTDGSQAMLRFVIDEQQLADYPYHGTIAVEIGEPRRIAAVTKMPGQA